VVGAQDTAPATTCQDMRTTPSRPWAWDGGTAAAEVAVEVAAEVAAGAAAGAAVVRAPTRT
jgi:hypothetical protein